jgi:inner membrane protein
MDPVTHTLIGAGLAQGLFKRRVGPEAVPVLCVASNLPDIDVLVHLTGDPLSITLRRSFGHSAFLLPLWSLALSLLLQRRYPHKSLKTLFRLCLLGACVHVFFDLVNSFGVLLLWPFSSWRHEFAIIFIIDLALTGLLAAPYIVCAWEKTRGRLEAACRLSLACVAAYVLLCAAGRVAAGHLLAHETGGVKPEFSYIFPEPLGPHRWRGVTREGGLYRVYLIRLMGRTCDLMKEARTELEAPLVQEARATPRGRRLEAFFIASGRCVTVVARFRRHTNRLCMLPWHSRR